MVKATSNASKTLKSVLIVLALIVGLLAYYRGLAMAGSNSDRVKKAIAEVGAKWEAGDTADSELPDNLKQLRLGFIPPSTTPDATQIATGHLNFRAALPASLDWRNNNGNYVTPVKDQGLCGSCWAFGSTAALESATLIANNTQTPNLDLSEQVLISCSTINGCSGGSIAGAGIFLQSIGTPPEACYPYTATNGNCAQACANRLSNSDKAATWQYVGMPGDMTADILKSALNYYGPIVVSMSVFDDFYTYKSGIYQHVTGNYQGGHVVLLVGYDDAGQYFIAKNSWGTSYGESGYVRISYPEVGTLTQFGQYAVEYTVTPSSGTPAQQNQLTVIISGAGTGSVTPSTGTLAWNGQIGSGQYKPADVVTLTAKAASNSASAFTAWQGCPSIVNTTQCVVSMSSPRMVTAVFGTVTDTLTVKKAGLGSGTVNSADNGISCGTRCSAQYAQNSWMTLTAVAAQGSLFIGWTGCMSPSGNSCFLNMAGPQSVTATFGLPSAALTVQKSGTGTGTITSTPAGISCGSSCLYYYPQNTSVTLTATPDAGSTFVSWSGCTSTSGATCTAGMAAATTVTATFTRQTSGVSLSVYESGTGTGTVTSAPAGISCGSSSSSCSYNYTLNTSVTLTATPDAGSTLASWLGCTPLSGFTCTVTMSAAKSVTVTFNKQTTGTALTVLRTGNGSGTVTSAPAGISCGSSSSSCSAPFAQNTKVTLTATPAAGSILWGQSGCDTFSGNTCTVTMSGARNVTFTFNLQTATLFVTKAGTGSGTITSSPAGLTCSSASCYGFFTLNSQTTLTATPATGSSFSGWSGCTSTTGNVCTVTMSASKSVTATFK